MPEALVNPNLIRWAIHRSQLDPAVIAKKVGTRLDKILAWEAGEARPTFRQAQKFAGSVHIPFGYLFLDSPPEEPLPIPDFRTVGDQNLTEPSPDFLDLINDVMRKWTWFLDYAREQEIEEVPFVGRFDSESQPDDVAKDIAKTIGVNDQMRASAGTWEGFLSSLIHNAEENGIWIIRSGIVGNNTHRPLRVEEFRGFVISDELAPLIFLNGKDAKAAQIFTLAHELAHLWIGQSGISNVSLGRKNTELANGIERFCNQVAAELLVPQKIFLSRWRNDLEIAENCNLLVRYFRVSNMVVARRAFELGLVDWDTYWGFFEEQKEKWLTARLNADGGGDYYRTMKTRNGGVFSRAVITSVYGGRLTYKDAGALLGVSVGNFDRFAQAVGLQ